VKPLNRFDRRKGKISRREFLGATLAVGAAAAAAPCFLPAKALGAAASANKLNFAVIGVGGRGHGALLPELLNLGEYCNVVALCDVDSAVISNARNYVAKNVANSGDAIDRFKIYDDYRKLLELEKSLDGVVIAVGNRWHVPMSSAFLKAGKHGCVYLAEKGILWANPWGEGGLVSLSGEATLRGVFEHEACKPVPVTLPRVATQNHMVEWLTACRQGTATFSDFDIGGRVTEICLTGTLSLRLGRPIEYDGAAMKVSGAPEADVLIHKPQRKQWFL
jgi:hypothetical protein